MSVADSTTYPFLFSSHKESLLEFSEYPTALLKTEIYM